MTSLIFKVRLNNLKKSKQFELGLGLRSRLGVFHETSCMEIVTCNIARATCNNFSQGT